MPVLLEISENPNCDAMDAQVFQCRSSVRVVSHIQRAGPGGTEWCAVTGIEEGGSRCPATACMVDDSGDGACYLVVGGDWGLRLKPANDGGEWDLGDASQWGARYFLPAGDGAALRFE